MTLIKHKKKHNYLEITVIELKKIRQAFDINLITQQTEKR